MKTRTKLVHELRVTEEVAFLLLFYFLYPYVGSVYQSYFDVITLIIGSPFFYCVMDYNHCLQPSPPRQHKC
jgi:hypothetical protein